MTENTVFKAVNKFFGVGDKPAPKSKTQAEKDDDIKHRNKFRDGPNDDMSKPAKKKKAKKQGTGILARSRKKKIDDAVKKAQ